MYQRLLFIIKINFWAIGIVLTLNVFNIIVANYILNEIYQLIYFSLGYCFLILFLLAYLKSKKKQYVLFYSISLALLIMGGVIMETLFDPTVCNGNTLFIPNRFIMMFATSLLLFVTIFLNYFYQGKLMQIFVVLGFALIHYYCISMTTYLNYISFFNNLLFNN